MLDQEVLDLLLQAGRALHAEIEQASLTSVQWLALHYFERTNLASRTVSGLAAFQSTTRGTASLTIKHLVSQGLLARSQPERDRRGSSFVVTELGRRALEKRAHAELIDYLRSLDTSQLQALRSLLRAVLAQLVTVPGLRAFGTCRDCTHLLTRNRTTGEQQHLCRLTHDAIAPLQLDLLCKSFQVKERGEEQSGAPR